MQLRDYQQIMVDDIATAWREGARNVCAVLPTGGGKTVVFGHILREHGGYSCAIAHRSELVSQMSVTLARLEMPHRIIAPLETIRSIVSLQLQETGRNWHDANARCGVAGIDSLARRDLGEWGRRVSLWVQDEAHHLLRANKWGKGIAQFASAKGLGVTATPLRADGRGLGRHADGVMDVLVEGPGTRALIQRGYLSDYRIFAPPSDMDMSQVAVSAATGDYVPEGMRRAAKASHIVGDVVDHYRRLTPGKRGVTFCPSVELAEETALRFREAGVPAECITADTPASVRAEALRRLARGDLLQITNVDLFGEGFDLPALEVVCMARPTQSYGLFAQQFGRSLRPLDGKDRAVIIDHAQNVARHGLPDAPREWSLDRRERRSRGTTPTTVRICLECMGVYERPAVICPYCGCAHVPALRSGPEHVDGDLTEMDEATLARLRGGVIDVEAPARFPRDVSREIRGAIDRRHWARNHAQVALREQISLWAGWQRDQGRDDPEIYRRFYMAFDVDVLSAQGLGRPEADALRGRVEAALSDARIVAAAA